MENSYNENERRIADLTQTFNVRLGTLKELFGVTQQVAGDARSNFDASITNVQYPGRSEFLTMLVEKLGSGIELPSVEEMEQLWWELAARNDRVRESRQVQYRRNFAGRRREPTEVVRVGLFNIVSDGKYLTYIQETGNVTELAPSTRARSLYR